MRSCIFDMELQSFIYYFILLSTFYHELDLSIKKTSASTIMCTNHDETQSTKSGFETLFSSVLRILRFFVVLHLF
jgi:hypothetical protein